MSFLSKIMCHWAQSSANFSWCICSGLSSERQCAQSIQLLVLSSTPFSSGTSYSASTCSSDLCSKGTAVQLFFPVLLTWCHMLVCDSFWELNTLDVAVEHSIYLIAKHLLCDDPSRMPIINLNLGYKLLAFCFLKLCHKIAFLNRAQKTPCSLCLLAFWRR